MPVILSTQEVETGRIVQFQAGAAKIVHMIPTQPIKSRVWWHTPVIPAMMKS
jgi:hypothetical protein